MLKKLILLTGLLFVSMKNSNPDNLNEQSSTQASTDAKRNLKEKERDDLKQEIEEIENSIETNDIIISLDKDMKKLKEQLQSFKGTHEYMAMFLPDDEMQDNYDKIQTRQNEIERIKERTQEAKEIFAADIENAEHNKEQILQKQAQFKELQEKIAIETAKLEHENFLPEKLYSNKDEEQKQ